MDSVDDIREIQKQTGTTFYFATRFLPQSIQEDTYVLYSFFREADEIVDTTNPDPNQKDKLEKLRKGAKGELETDDVVVDAFNEVRKQNNIKLDDIDAFIDSMIMDINKNSYEDFNDLQIYIDGSASAVGRMMVSIMDIETQDALLHATVLGEAYQMTNFLRDIQEDIELYNRVYIPNNTLDKFDISRHDIKEGNINKSFKKAMEYELQRTEELYKKGVRGIKYIPEDAQFGVFLSAVLYSEYHKMIRDCDYNVYDNNLELSKTDKIRMFIRSYWNWRRSESIIEAFRRSSSIYRTSGKSLPSLDVSSPTIHK